MGGASSAGGAPAPDPLIGTLIDGRYRICERIGAGSTGVVYRASQYALGRDVAIKLVNADVLKEDEWQRRFATEARVIAQLRHPNTLKLIDFGLDARGRPYLVTELLVGRSLDELFALGEVRPQVLIELLAQVAGSLAEAHAAGIVHRDLKPANIFVEQVGATDVVRVLDFGLAKLADAPHQSDVGSVVGTPAFMAPEQVLRQPVDGRSDLYSLGVIAYLGLSGHTPFADDNPMRLLSAQVRDAPPALGAHTPRGERIPRELAALVMRLLAKDPAVRTASAAELKEQLERLASSWTEVPRYPSTGDMPPVPTALPTGPGLGKAELLAAAGRTEALSESSAGAAVTLPPKPLPDPLDDVLPVGMAVAGYRIGRCLGAGGHARVYDAEEVGTGRRVAIKVLRQRLAQRERMVKRFLREAKVGADIAHPALVPVLDVGHLPDGRPYFVMELIEGVDLAERIEVHGRCSVAEAREILEPLARALSAAHAAGVVHRDVKPSNVLLTGGNPPEVKLLDFGVAKLLDPPPEEAGLSTHADRLGSSIAMAPEQVSGGPVDARTDVYAFGVLAFLVLTGRYPFEADRAEIVRFQQVHMAPPRPSALAPVPPAIEAFILKCLEKDPAERYASAQAMLEALEETFQTLVPTGAEGQGDAIGIHVEGQLREAAREDDDALVRLEEILQDAAQDLRAGGFTILWEAGDALFAAQLLGEEAEQSRRLRARTLALGQRFVTRLTGEDAQRGIGLRVVVHVDAASVRRAGPSLEIVGGPILRTASVGGRGAGLHASARATAGLPGVTTRRGDTGT